MRNVVTIILAIIASAANAQTTCGGPYGPNFRTSNGDGTETVTGRFNCIYEDPNPWSHTYQFSFPNVLTFQNITLQFVGNASASVSGHNDCPGKYYCQPRIVTVDNGILTDASGNTVSTTKMETGTSRFPVDVWESTTPLDSEVLYSFSVNGTDTVLSPGVTDTLVIKATYRDVVTPPTCNPECPE